MAPLEDTGAKAAADGPDYSEAEDGEGYADAVTRHAKYLGMDPKRDAAYLWIAEEALNADVPEGWVTGEGEGEYEGLIYYYNEGTGESTWDHPLDEYYRDKFARRKAKKKENDKRDPSESGNKRRSKPRAASSPSGTRRSGGTVSRRLGSDDDKDSGRSDRDGSKARPTERSQRPERVNDDRTFQRAASRRRGSGNHRSDRHKRDRSRKDVSEGENAASRSGKERDDAISARKRDDPQHRDSARHRDRDGDHESPSSRPLDGQESTSRTKRTSRQRSSHSRGYGSDRSTNGAAKRTNRREGTRTTRSTRSKKTRDGMTDSPRRSSSHHSHSDGDHRRRSVREAKGTPSRVHHVRERGRMKSKDDDQSKRHTRVRHSSAQGSSSGGVSVSPSGVGSEKGVSLGHKGRNGGGTIDGNGDNRRARESVPEHVDEREHRSRGPSTSSQRNQKQRGSSAANVVKDAVANAEDNASADDGREHRPQRRRKGNARPSSVVKDHHRTDPPVEPTSEASEDGVNGTDDTGKKFAAAKARGRAEDPTDVQGVKHEVKETANGGNENNSPRRELTGSIQHDPAGHSPLKVAEEDEVDAKEKLLADEGRTRTTVKHNDDDELQDLDFADELLDMESETPGEDDGGRNAGDHLKRQPESATRTRLSEDDAASTSVHEPLNDRSPSDNYKHATDSKRSRQDFSEKPEESTRTKTTETASATGRDGSRGTREADSNNEGKFQRFSGIEMDPDDRGDTSSAQDMPTAQRERIMDDDWPEVVQPLKLEHAEKDHSRKGPQLGRALTGRGAKGEGRAEFFEQPPGGANGNLHEISEVPWSESKRKLEGEIRRRTEAVEANTSTGTRSRRAPQRDDVDYGEADENADEIKRTKSESRTQVDRMNLDGHGMRVKFPTGESGRGTEEDRRGESNPRDRMDWKQHRRSSTSRGGDGDDRCGYQSGTDHATHSHPDSNTGRNSVSRHFRTGREGEASESRWLQSGDDGARLERRRDDFGREREREALATARDLEETVLRLENSLRLSKVREDNLEEDIVEATRRASVLRRQHATTLEEAEQRTAEAKRKLSVAVEEASQADKRFADAKREAAVDTKAAYQQEWKTKMASAEAVWRAEENTLRGIIEGCQQRATLADDALARKEDQEQVAKTVDSSAPCLQSRLASTEEELKAQTKLLQETRRCCAEANAKATSSLRELHESRDSVQKLMLEVAECSSNPTKISGGPKAPIKPSNILSLNKSRASTSEGALAQAAHDITALNDSLSRVNEEAVRKERQAEKTAEEVLRLHAQLGLAQEKTAHTEGRLDREKSAFDSVVETLRARAAELETANAAMERELHNGQQDTIARLREAERQRDAATYEARRSAKHAAAAEGWRQKEIHRANAAEAKASALGVEVAELRADAARSRSGNAAELAPHLATIAALQAQLDSARKEAMALAANAEHLKATHVTEMSSLKEEVSRKLPQIAEEAAAEAGRQWRSKVEEETAAVRAERDHRLRELQTALSEGEASRRADLASARGDTEKFRVMAEKLAAENRSMRGELQHVLLTTKAHSPLRATAGISHGPPEQSHVRKSGGPLSIDGVASGGAHGGGKGRMNVSGFASREGDLYCGDHDNDGVLGEGHGGVSRTGVEGRHHPGYDVPSGGDGDRPTSRGSWDRKVHAEVLRQVEAHMNALRAELRSAPFSNLAVDVVSSNFAEQDRYSASRRSAGHTEIGRCLAAANAPAFVDRRGKFNGASPETDGLEKRGKGLTDTEEMRLNRLLRATNSKNSTPDQGNEGLDFWDVEDASHLTGDRTGSRNSTITGQVSGTIGSSRDTTGYFSGLDEPGSSAGAALMGEQGRRRETPLVGSGDGVSRELFASPTVDGRPMPRRATSDGGVVDSVPRTHATEAPGTRVATGIRPSPKDGRLKGADDDNLEDISDGGFHSGCWQRKYAAGEMR